MDNKVIIDEIKKDHYIIKITSSISNSKNNVFACILGKDYTSHCYIKHGNENFKEITFTSLDCKNIETYYFSESNDFALVCKNDNKFKVISFNFNNYLQDNLINI